MTTEVCYLLHFMSRYQHAGHYIGSAVMMEERVREHASGSCDVNLLNVIKAAGIKFVVARTWPGDRKFERKLKNRGSAVRLCPLCSGEKSLQTLLEEYPINEELLNENH